MAKETRDQWAQWLLQRRHGGDQARLEAMQKSLFEMRDGVLKHANIIPGDILLDVGCGDGLIAFGALPLVGEKGTVIFSDISRDLLHYCQERAAEQNELERCRFVESSADDLSALESGSVDIVTTRSVLIYVEEKQRSLEEFYRVLRPGGRISLFEPINRFAYPEPPQRFFGYDATPIMHLVYKIFTAYAQKQNLATNPMMNFDERDLVQIAEDAGFPEVHLELHIHIVPANIADITYNWETFLKTAPNPLAPTLEEAMQQTLTEEEIEQFTAYLRPLVETGQRVERSARAFLWAVKH